MVKTISTTRKIHAILLNVKINQPKLVSMCVHLTQWRIAMGLSLPPTPFKNKFFIMLGRNGGFCETVGPDIRNAGILTYTIKVLV